MKDGEIEFESQKRELMVYRQIEALQGQWMSSKC